MEAHHQPTSRSKREGGIGESQGEGEREKSANRERTKDKGVREERPE